ncbi:MAG TPA: hypothetical protein VFZ66_23795 [Herpetosiphonaceae bacterium]
MSHKIIVLIAMVLLLAGVGLAFSRPAATVTPNDAAFTTTTITDDGWICTDTVAASSCEPAP